MNKSDLNSPPTSQNEVIMVLFHGSSFYKQTVMRQKNAITLSIVHVAPNLDTLSFRVCLKESHKQKKFSCVLLRLLEILRSVYKLPQKVPPENSDSVCSFSVSLSSSS